MKQERVILSFIMVIIGLLVAGIAFYFYQNSKLTTNPSTLINPKSTQTPKQTIFLSINSPRDEEVVSSKTLVISGKTSADATVVIITKSDQLVVKPSTQGDFSTTIDLENDQNLIRIYAISPKGEVSTAERTITYSTNNF